MLWLRTFPPESTHWVTRHYSRLVGLHSKLVSQAYHPASYSFQFHYLPEDLCSYNLINIKDWAIPLSISWKERFTLFILYFFKWIWYTFLFWGFQGVIWDDIRAHWDIFVICLLVILDIFIDPIGNLDKKILCLRASHNDEKSKSSHQDCDWLHPRLMPTASLSD